MALPPEDQLALLIEKASEGGVYVLDGERMLWIDLARAQALGLTAASLGGVAVDVTARGREEVAARAEASRRASEKLLHDAFHDSLTGLPNRALFMDRLSHRLALEKRRPQTSFSVLFLAVDRFKVLNDSLGHVRGGELLCEVGRRLQSVLRGFDTVARLGGDEFTVLLEDVPDHPSARKVADRLQDALKAPFKLGG